MPDDKKKDEVDGGLVALQKQLADTTAENERLKVAVKSKVIQPAPAPGNVPTKEDIEKRFWTDPLDMTSAIANRAVFEAEQRIMSNVIPSQREAARKEIRGSGIDAEIFDKYAAEIDAAINGMQPQFQGNIQVWRNALNIIKGDHFDDITKFKADKRAAEGGDSIVTTTRTNDGPALPSGRQPPPPKEKPLSDDEKRIAGGLELTDAEYKRGQHRYDNQDTEWSKVVTFSSATKRRADAATRLAAKQKAS